MINIATGFAVVGLAIVVGYLAAALKLFPPGTSQVLGRLCFFVLSPFLLFSVLARADLHVLFSSLLPVSALSALVMFVLYGVVARWVLRRDWGATLVGSYGAGYVNANNIGLPIATYVLGSAAFSAPIILMQLLIFSPVILAVLDAVSSGKSAPGRNLLRTLRNPMIVGAALGVIVALSRIELPGLIMDPIESLGHAAVPVLLISFGMSMHSQRALTVPGTRRDSIIAATMKVVVMPVVAYLIGHLVFRLSGDALRAVVIMAALPTAQNVFNYAQRYNVGVVVARDTVLLSTLACVPVLLVIALTL